MKYFTHNPLSNKALEADYYKHRAEETQTKKAKPVKVKHRVPEDKRLAIAADLRAMTKGAVMSKWHISQPTYDSIYGDMSLGKLGGL